MLSDGNMFTVSAKRFRCTSVFPANFIGIKASGVHDTSFHNIMKCDVDIRVNSYAPVTLPGGTTMFQELGERMTKKTTELLPPTTKIKVVVLRERQHSVRIGGSILFFQHIPADVDVEGEYDGSCPTIVDRKCF